MAATVSKLLSSRRPGRETLDPYRKRPRRTAACAASRMPLPMGLNGRRRQEPRECEAPSVSRWVQERSGGAAGGWWTSCSGAGVAFFCALQKRASYACRSMRSKHQAGPVVTRYQGNRPPLFFRQDLLGGQSLNHTHLPLAVGTLPNRGLMSDKWSGGVRRRRCIAESSANRE
jgi:hypothetical protein